MLEKAFIGSKKYWIWIGLLCFLISIGSIAYYIQFVNGLCVTDMSRDISWGFYIAQFTFFVGIASSAVIVVLPYYLHNIKQFGKITILGEFIAIASVIMSMLFIFVDMGQPLRIMNVLLYPSFNSVILWDVISLGGYLFLNILISYTTWNIENKGVATPKWIRPLIILSIPWAFSIHTVTAFIYSGLAARPFWLTAIMAPRFLATAFAAGPAFIIILCLFLRKNANYNVGYNSLQKLAIIAAYAMYMNVFFLLLELFTAFYSGMREHIQHFKLLYLGLEGNNTLVPLMWLSSIAAIVSLIILTIPRFRKNTNFLLSASILIFLSVWLDKGLAMVIAGFIPNPLGSISTYIPTLIEILVSTGILALGLLIITILYKSALSVYQMIKE